ncbi:putative transcription factor MYB-related family [Helianthus annuus]|uniref:Putative myb domain, plant, Homeodomain-like protein n=1 Tax=Helianthus annuus TaxID=4232 RepID=A0A251UY19_HELAN|nr:transcription factor BOA [Helianthus annuus]KAF5782161.1 putative transcription factor MYB-related family [Helianthus annuus]KAJ0501673.1 putative transcription factor MYB-HB-like family [Helianthus annuus]KAJ0509547.1 putative transcription factor MYB-HB-like family [Helianthus annuus]KAJ0517587.1 putative transcription factor MYB-HB-like family [Helianthus annuus]KAJ0685599.1 putative transcription factor MYB-HB-like family [Helianthus annuus]
MAEEVRITAGAEDDDERVFQWEDGLPTGDDLTPLTQSLISSELLSAFNITPEPYRSIIDVNRASQNTFANLQPSVNRFNATTSFKGVENRQMDLETADLTHGGSGYRKIQRIGGSGDGYGGGAVEETKLDLQTAGSDYRKLQRFGSGGVGAVEETEIETETETGDQSARVSKRQRLVWTPQLHKRFIEVVAHLGVKNAVPKTIMQLMNVEGLTRENVASHLQKYRLYLKRMQGGPSGSDPAHESGGSRNGYHPMVHQMPNSYAYNVQQGNWSGNGFDFGYQHGMTPNKK